MSRFGAVVLDVDSTLSAIEGIDWLAARRGMLLAEEIAELTGKAMEGSVPIESLYGLRLDLVRPDKKEIAALSDEYAARIAPGAAAALRDLRAAGIALRVVSGGLREALLPFLATLGFSGDEVHAVGICFDRAGKYAGWETQSPLAVSGGKAVVVRSLRLPEPVLAVGDGATDLALKSIGVTFAAFTGFAHRADIVAGADLVLEAFDLLPPLVLG